MDEVGDHPSPAEYGSRSPEGMPPGLGRPGARAAGESRSAAVIDLLDREGQVRQTIPVATWPLRIGRALDNDVVLADPHVAPHHLRIDAGESGQHQLTVGDTRNGVQLGASRLAAGEQRILPDQPGAIELSLGRTTLRLRLPGQMLAPELPLAAGLTRRRHAAQVALAAFVLLAGLFFNTWLDSDPDALTRNAAGVLVGAVFGAMVWCGLWALLSKTFTRQGRFGWHLRVFLFASVAWLVVGNLPNLVAFALSWPGLSDFTFIATYAVAGTALYFHLLAVEPARHRLMRWFALAAVVAGVAMTLWTNVQRSDRFGEELYLSHLFPPALRLAKPVAPARFIDGVAAMQAGLDKKAKEPARGEGGGSDDE